MNNDDIVKVLQEILEMLKRIERNQPNPLDEGVSRREWLTW